MTATTEVTTEMDMVTTEDMTIIVKAIGGRYSYEKE